MIHYSQFKLQPLQLLGILQIAAKENCLRFARSWQTTFLSCHRSRPLQGSICLLSHSALQPTADQFCVITWRSRTEQNIYQDTKSIECTSSRLYRGIYHRNLGTEYNSWIYLQYSIHSGKECITLLQERKNIVLLTLLAFIISTRTVLTFFSQKTLPNNVQCQQKLLIISKSTKL